jgi:hypothetical protein
MMPDTKPEIAGPSSPPKGILEQHLSALFVLGRADRAWLTGITHTQRLRASTSASSHPDRDVNAKSIITKPLS